MTVANSVSRREDERVAREILARLRGLVEPALDAAIARVSPELHPALDYHFAGGGKFVRAGLTLLSASACGADESVALDGAVAIELIHNFSLIHDDIIDRDVERRHRQSVWAEYGVGPAIIAGDALSTLAMQLLLERPTPPRLAAATCLADATQEMIKGQSEDMAAEEKSSLSVSECLAVADGKTAALLSCACALGALLADAPALVVGAMSDFGRHLGLAFQAIDDVLGIWGEPQLTGKPIGNDLRRRKKTLPVSFAHARGLDVFATVDSDDDELSDEDVVRITTLLEGSGARQETVDLGDDQLAAALGALDRVALSDGARGDLAAVARFVVGRDR
ncbi:MAG TPA: polyprenyl synthetase family protein [Acidimicrobiales bacterium]|nr:polyprenyl synthetase family protein [Acidimicrobiales bacterium]